MQRDRLVLAAEEEAENEQQQGVDGAQQEDEHEQAEQCEVRQR